MSSRLEINFNRLLSRCEMLAKDKQLWDWRLEKYISALQGQLTELKKSHCRPSQEHLNDYNRKVDFLKGIMEAEKLPTTNERALASEKLATVTSTASSAGNSASSTELHLHTKARYQRDAREELLGISHNEQGTGKPKQKEQENEDIDSLIQHHNRMQEHLAEEMLMLTKNLKESVRESGRIVKDDTKKLAETNKVADVNVTKLKKESERLEKHTQTCSWWVWLMLVLVTLTFLWMIMFMKLFPKKAYVDYTHDNYVDDHEHEL